MKKVFGRNGIGAVCRNPVSVTTGQTVVRRRMFLRRYGSKQGELQNSKGGRQRPRIWRGSFLEQREINNLGGVFVSVCVGEESRGRAGHTSCLSSDEAQRGFLARSTIHKVWFIDSSWRRRRHEGQAPSWKASHSCRKKGKSGKMPGTYQV